MRIDKDNIKIILILLVVCLGIGYSYLNTELNINGTANINSANWSVYWNNVQVESGSVEATTPTIDSDKTTVSYTVTLEKPGDYYEFTVDAVNAGTIDAMIETINSKLNGVTMEEAPAYLDYEISYEDGASLEENQELLHDSTETYKVHIGYSENIEANELPTTNQSLSLEFTVTYKQANEDAIEVDHSFNGHSWKAIIANVRSGNTDNYNVGDTKEVDMGSLGTQTLRIANKSTPTECETAGFSQTACGFVLEFADIITEHIMNPWDSSVTTLGNGTIGGWPASEMRTYVNNDIYNALPSELKSGIINTTVISGHNTDDTTNFITIDKLYLLSTHEVWEDVGNAYYWDTAYDYTRQLDYYENAGVTTTSNYSEAIKQNYRSSWWLRSADPTRICCFYHVFYTGNWNSYYSNFNYGVSPAFRIG